MDWININEKMPDERCLLQTTSKMIVIGDWYKGVWRVDGAIYWENKQLKSNYNKEDITHWMPLPIVWGG